MKLLTQHSNDYQALADLTLPGKRTYAARWGFELIEQGLTAPVTCWQRPEGWLAALQSMAADEWLLFTGTDALITNHTIDARQLCDPAADLVVAADGNGLQSDVMLLRRCPAIETLLREVCAHRDRPTNNEQDALNIELSQAMNYADYTQKVGRLKQGGEPPSPALLQRLERWLNRSAVMVKLIPQRQCNAYPHTLYGGTGREPYSWQPGDFIAHLPGLPNAVRIEWIKNATVKAQ